MCKLIKTKAGQIVARFTGTEDIEKGYYYGEKPDGSAGLFAKACVEIHENEDSVWESLYHPKPKEEKKPSKPKKRGVKWERTTEIGAYCRTLGYLASRASISAEVHPSAESYFEDRYSQLKDGELPSNQYYYLINNRNGIELRIVCEIPSFEYDLGNLKFAPIGKNGTGRINSNGLVWELLEMGFALGHSHDIEKIKSEIPEQYRNDFEEGLKVA